MISGRGNHFFFSWSDAAAHGLHAVSMHCAPSESTNDSGVHSLLDRYCVRLKALSRVNFSVERVLKSNLLAASACGVVAAMLTFLMLGIGITVTPDGWAYWEGSVALLNGQGYVRFGGGPINAFPPLYSILLAGTQFVFGVSGATLILTTSLLAGLTVAIWSFARFDLRTGTKPDRLLAWAFALFAAFFVPSYFTALLSETQFLPMCGLLIVLINRAIMRPAERFAPTVIAGATLLLAMLLTRNSSVALVVPLVLLGFVYGRRFSKCKALIASMAFVGAIVVWYVIRTMMGQAQSHGIDAVGHYSMREYAQQLFTDFALRVAPLRFGGGFVVAALMLISGVWAYRSYARRGVHGNLVLLNASWSVASLLVLFALFNVTHVTDELAGRFLWHYVLHFIFIFSVVAAFVPMPRGRALTALMIAVLSIQCARTISHLSLRASGRETANVQSFHTIRFDFVDRPPQPDGIRTLISPRDFGNVE